MYPLTTLHFSVSWGDAQNTVNFSEVSGLTMEAEIVQYRGGADPQHATHQLPGNCKYGPVTCKRGICPQGSGNGLFEWFNSVTIGAVDRRDVTVSLLNEEGNPAMTWKISDAWPTKLEGPGLKSTGTDAAIESVTFACGRIVIQTS
jgi:phage tail-like protein